MQHRRVRHRHGRAAAARHFDQPELDVLDRKVFYRLIVEARQRLGCEPGLLRPPVQRELLAAAGDRDVERPLDLLEVFVERAAQIGEALVVDGHEGKFDRIQLAASRTQTSPRREWGSASVTRTSTNCPIRRGAQRKLTARLFSVRPVSSCASFFEGPSTSTRCTVPTIAWLT